MTKTLDEDACYRALVTHDARFDGAFFVGVRTTGVYCRPVCRARTPRRENCVFFSRAAQAEQGGFRACFRCRPERAPGHAMNSNVDAVPRLVLAATHKIEEGALNEGSVDDLAASLGVGARHLRRTLREELGVGPLELALSRRVAVARELLLGTSLPITEVAFASGFSSVRRFNALYRSHQGMTPSEVRRPRLSHRKAIPPGLRLVLDVRPPFDPAPAFSFLKARAVPSSETVTGDTYRRAVALDDAKGTRHIGIISVRPAVSKSALIVDVSPSLAPVLMVVAARVRHAFDTDSDPSLIGAHLCKDPFLRAYVKRRPALRVQGAFDPFEWAVRAILGQQVSVRAARTLASRLVERFGIAVATETSPTFAWPDPQRLANARPDALAAIGITSARARTLHALAVSMAEGAIALDRHGDVEATVETLLSIPGIGRWTADYIALRSLGWPDAFPAGDLVLRKVMGGLSAREADVRSQMWKPWRAYAATHLWTGTSEDTEA